MRRTLPAVLAAILVAGVALAANIDNAKRFFKGGFEVVAGEPGPEARVVGRGTFQDGAQQVALDDGAASGTYTFWITELPPNAEGSGYRAYVSEIGLEGNR